LLAKIERVFNLKNYILVAINALNKTFT
jgi:hypothetical protein